MKNAIEVNKQSTVWIKKAGMVSLFGGGVYFGTKY